MTDLRAARERVIRDWYRRMCDSLTEALPGLLDDLEAADREFPLEAITVRRSVPTDAELTAWIEAHPAEFAKRAAGWVRVLGDPPVAPDPPLAPAARARKPRGGTAGG